MGEKDKVYICKTCDRKFNTERGIIQHLSKKSEILIATRMEIEKKEAFRKKILKEMLWDGHDGHKN